MIRSRLTRHTMQLCPALRFIIVPMSESAHFTPRYDRLALAVFSAIWNMLHRPRLAARTVFARYRRHCRRRGPNNVLLDVTTQLDWLRDIGFADADCYWKWPSLL